jgi:hypothetical protein
VPGYPEVFAIGDMAYLLDTDGRPLPGIAPVAIQQGEHVARTIRARLAGHPSTEAFRYTDKGTLATIGRAKAVAQIGGLQLWGLPAWAMWLLVHLLYLVGFQNRVLVLMRWSFSFVTRGPGGAGHHRPVITGAEEVVHNDLTRRQPAARPSRAASRTTPAGRAASDASRSSGPQRRAPPTPAVKWSRVEGPQTPCGGTAACDYEQAVGRALSARGRSRSGAGPPRTDRAHM